MICGDRTANYSMSVPLQAACALKLRHLGGHGSAGMDSSMQVFVQNFAGTATLQTHNMRPLG